MRWNSQISLSADNTAPHQIPSGRNQRILAVQLQANDPSAFLRRHSQERGHSSGIEIEYQENKVLVTFVQLLIIN